MSASVFDNIRYHNNNGFLHFAANSWINTFRLDMGRMVDISKISRYHFMTSSTRIPTSTVLLQQFLAHIITEVVSFNHLTYSLKCFTLRDCRAVEIKNLPSCCTHFCNTVAPIIGLYSMQNYVIINLLTHCVTTATTTTTTITTTITTTTTTSNTATTTTSTTTTPSYNYYSYNCYSYSNYY